MEENESQVHAVDDVNDLIMENMLKRGSISYKDGRTPLHSAASCNQDAVEAASCLLEHGAKVDYQDPSGWTPLHCAGTEPFFFL